MPSYPHQVPTLLSPTRLSDYLIGIFPVVPSRKGIKKAIKKGWVVVDEEPGTTGRYLKGGEMITLRLPEPPASEKLPNISLNVIFEDDYLAVVEKPAGLLVSGNKWMTLTNALPGNLRPSSLTDALAHPQPVHRLDYPTSGLLIIGKTATALTELGAMLADRKIEKTYLAVCIGELPERGTINLPIEGKKAISHFEQLSRLNSKRFTYLNLVRLQLETGRRHQLRIHLASLSCPILGDATYGLPELILKGKGLYLQAQSLSFIHPKSFQQLSYSVEPPTKFSRLFPDIEDHII